MGGWLEQLGIKLISTQVEVGVELGKISASKHEKLRKNKKKIGSNDESLRKLEPQ